MSDYDLEAFEELSIDQFEEKLFKLLRLCEQLKAENIALRARQVTLLEERSELEDKNALARSRVESILTRLKGKEAEI